MIICREIKIDIDPEFHNPCMLAIRLLRVLALCKLMNYLVDAHVSATKGIHIRVYIPDKIPLSKLFAIRAILGDDWMRLQYDYARFAKGLDHTILFNFKTIVKNFKIIRKGVEKRVELEKLIDDIIRLCEVRTFSRKFMRRKRNNIH